MHIFTKMVSQQGSGTSQSTHNGLVLVSDTYDYPLTINFAYQTHDSVGDQLFYDYNVTLEHGYDRKLYAETLGKHTTITTTQHARGSMVDAPYILCDAA